MSSDGAADVTGGRGSPIKKFGLALLGVVAFVAASIALENYVGIPFDTTYRVGCASACVLFIYKLQTDLPDTQWLRISLWLAALVNIGIFFTPLVDRPSSRGELMIFAVPDVVVTLIIRILTLRPVDVNQRAKRLQLIVFLLFACMICAVLLWAAITEAHRLR